MGRGGGLDPSDNVSAIRPTDPWTDGRSRGRQHTQVFVQSKYKGLLHNTQGSSSARFGYFFALVRLVLLVWCFFLWMLTRLGPFVQNMVAVSSLTKKKEAGGILCISQI